MGFTLKLDRSNFLTKLVWSIVFGQLRRYGEVLLTSHQIKFADKVYGLLQTSKISEAYLLGLIPQIQADFIEIYAHPTMMNMGEPFNGLLEAGEVELAALLSEQVHQTLTDYGFELTHF